MTRWRRADRDWAIAGASLRSAGVHDQMAPQDGLYTVTERSSEGESVRLIGAIREVTVAAKAPERLATLLAAADTRIVTLTVTEKGYWRRPDGATDLAGIVADGNSIYHHLAQAVVARQAAGLAPLTLVSCDNLPDNGRVLRAGVAAFLDHQAKRRRATGSSATGAAPTPWSTASSPPSPMTIARGSRRRWGCATRPPSSPNPIANG